MDTLAKLMAIEDIKQLKARYFRLMDMRDFAGMAQVFCREAVFDCTEGSRIFPLHDSPQGAVGPMQYGREAIIAWVQASFAEVTSVHHGHCHEVTIDSETEAHGVIAMEDYLRSADRKTLLLHAAGHYHETYRFEDGAWRIAKTKLTRLFSEGALPKRAD